MHRIPSVAAVAFLLLAGQAAFAGIYSGKIESVNARTKKIIVRLSSTNKTATYVLESSTTVKLNRKETTLDQLEPGLRVTVVTSKSGALRTISARSLTSTPTRTSKPKTTASSPAPEPAPSRSSSPAPSRTSTSSVRSADWPAFRGPNGDNISQETGLLAQWPAGGPELTWTGSGAGEGYSAVSIANGRVYTMGNVGGSEMIVAFDLSNGEKLWEARNGSGYQDGTGNGPRGTPAVDGNSVYGLGGNGDLSCVDTESGQVRWHVNILREFGGSNITWGISESPLVDGDKVICTPGGRQGSVVALNKQTGRPIWTAQVPGNPNAGYATPLAVTVGRVKQYIVFTSKSVVGIRATNGDVLWGDDKAANGTANCATPLFFNNHVFSSSDYGTGASLVRLQTRGNRVTTSSVYFTKNMKNHHGGMVLVDGYIYGSNSEMLSCINAQDGEPAWRQRGMKGSVIFADGHIYFRNEGGPVSLVEATPEGFREKSRFNQPNRSGRPAWAHPVIADGKLFLRDQDNVLVYNVRG